MGLRLRLRGDREVRSSTRASRNAGRPALADWGALRAGFQLDGPRDPARHLGPSARSLEREPKADRDKTADRPKGTHMASGRGNKDEVAFREKLPSTFGRGAGGKGGLFLFNSPHPNPLPAGEGTQNLQDSSFCRFSSSLLRQRQARCRCAVATRSFIRSSTK